MEPGRLENEDLYRALFASLDAVYVHDLEGRFIDANDAALELAGYSREELLGSDISLLLDESQVAVLRAAVGELLRSGELAARPRFRMRRKDGADVYVETNASVALREGKPYAILGVAHDITQLVEAERALADQNAALVELNRLAIDLSRAATSEAIETLVVERLLRISGGVAAMFAEYDPAPRTVTVKRATLPPGVLERALRLLGREIVGLQTVVGDDRYRDIVARPVRVSHDLDDAGLGGVSPSEAASMQTLLMADRFVSLAYLVDGALFGLSVLALAEGGDDPPEGVLDTFSSLVALALRRSRAEMALQMSEERQRLVTGNISDVIWTTDTEGRFTYVSSSVEKLSGYAPAERLGRRVTEALTPESAVIAEHAIAEAVAQIMAGHPVAGLRLVLEQPTKDASTIWTEHTVSELRDVSGRWIGFAGVTRDLTDRRAAEDALKRSEQKYRTVVDNLHEGVLVASEGGVLYYNSRLAQMLGYTIDEMGSVDLASALHPDDRLGVRARLSAIVEHRDPDPHLELRLITKAGDTRTMSVHASAIEWQGQRAVIVFLEDVSEFKRAVADQELSTEILRMLNETGDTPDSVERVAAVIKASTGFDSVGIRLRAMDGGGERRADATGSMRLAGMCGLVISGSTDSGLPFFTRGGSFWTNDASQLVDSPLADDLPAGPLDVCVDPGHASVAMVPIRDDQQIVGLLHLGDHRTGRLSLEAVGRLEGIAAHIGAALVRRKAATALRESRERYQTLVNLSPDAIVVDVDGRYQFANEAAARLFGADSPEALVGAVVMERMHPDYREIVATRAAQVAAGGVSSPREIKILRFDGDVLDVEVTAARIEFDGRLAKQVVYRDITERKLADARQRELEHQLQERQKLESLGVLAGGIAHDFNNMLTAIIGYSDLILASGISSPDETLADVGEIREAAGRAKDLTGAILAFSRRQPREVQTLALDSLVADLGPLLRRTIGEDIELVFRMPEEQAIVEADSSQLTQVVMNLVVNARDAMPFGGTMTIEVSRRLSAETPARVSPAPGPGEWVVLSVSDTGIGIEAEIIDRIFEPFFTTKRPGEGTGLGLSTAYGIARQSGGDIVAASELGKGSVFEVYLPPVGSGGGRGNAAAGAQAESDALGAVPAKGKTILLVEDEPAVRRLTVRLLEDEGYTVLPASDGDEAVSLARQPLAVIDLLLTDVVLPGSLQGDEVARGVVAERPGIKVIFMSGYPRQRHAPRWTLGRESQLPRQALLQGRTDRKGQRGAGARAVDSTRPPGCAKRKRRTPSGRPGFARGRSVCSTLLPRASCAGAVNSPSLERKGARWVRSTSTRSRLSGSGGWTSRTAWNWRRRRPIWRRETPG